MTSQMKQFIELSDMLSLRFECKHCKSELLLPSARDLSEKEECGRLNKCPACDKPWASINGSTCQPAIGKFLESLNTLRGMLGIHQGAFPAGFNLTIEVKKEAEQKQ